MPSQKKPKHKRDYAKEYAEYQGRPEQIRARSERKRPLTDRRKGNRY